MLAHKVCLSAHHRNIHYFRSLHGCAHFSRQRFATLGLKSSAWCSFFSWTESEGFLQKLDLIFVGLPISSSSYDDFVADRLIAEIWDTQTGLTPHTPARQLFPRVSVVNIHHSCDWLRSLVLRIYCSIFLFNGKKVYQALTFSQDLLKIRKCKIAILILEVIVNSLCLCCAAAECSEPVSLLLRCSFALNLTDTPKAGPEYFSFLLFCNSWPLRQEVWEEIIQDCATLTFIISIHYFI